VKLFSKYSNLCDHNPPTSQTDGQTDDICDRNTALCTKVHRAVKRKGKREGTHSHKTLYFGYLWGGHPRPIPIKFGMRVATRNIINVSNFCNKIFRGFISTGGQFPVFPLIMLVIVTTVLRYRAACDSLLTVVRQYSWLS